MGNANSQMLENLVQGSNCTLSSHACAQTHLLTDKQSTEKKLIAYANVS